MRKAKKVLALILLCPALAQAHPGRTDANGGHYNRKTGEYHYHQTEQYQTSCGKIVRVVDGDTLIVLIGGIQQRVRLLKINAPELGTPEGRAIKAYVVKLAEGKEACLKHRNIHGYYGRLLADVYVEGENLREKIKAKMKQAGAGS